MDNFEYSIQINDRDWEEFYSTAEECGLMQVSLAKEEELWLSDSEHEDTTNYKLSKKPKFIRVSLCPPPQEEHPAIQISQPVVSQSAQKCNRWLDPSEDVLSGSEDEEEFGSVSRFLCQKEYMLQKKESKPRMDITLPEPVCHDDITKPWNENSRRNSVREGLVEYMRTLNIEGNVQCKAEPQQNMERNSNAKVEPEHRVAEPTESMQSDGYPRPSSSLNYPNNSLNGAHKIESFSSVNDFVQGENIPKINESKEQTTGKMWHEAIPSGYLSKDNCSNTKQGLFAGPTILEEPPSVKHNGLVYYSMDNDVLDNSFEVAAKASVNSSAVEQNIPTSSIKELHSCISQSDLLNIEVKATSNTHNPADDKIATNSLVPVDITPTAWRNQTPPTYPSSASYRKTVLTLPEMYDFFFDDISDIVSLDTESNMARKEGIMYTPDMYEYFFLEDEEENRDKSKGDSTTKASSTDLASASSAVATWPEACEFFFADGPQDEDKEGILFSIPSSQVQNAADIIQSFVPKRLKGFTVRRAHHPGGCLIPQEHQGISRESNVSTSGSVAPYLYPSRSDACLVFLAFASWAVKSSDLQSSDGWKTALLANIGAISAIQYLRRRSRRTWQESPPQTGDET